MITYYYEEGKPQFTFEEVNGARTGAFQKWYESGKLESECPARQTDQDRVCKSWFPDGQLFRITTYRFNRTNGYEKEYFYTGKLRSEGPTKNRQKDGDWMYYDRDSDQSWLVTYTMGTVTSVEPEPPSGCIPDLNQEIEKRDRQKLKLDSGWCAFKPAEEQAQ